MRIKLAGFLTCFLANGLPVVIVSTTVASLWFAIITKLTAAGLSGISTRFPFNESLARTNLLRKYTKNIITHKFILPKYRITHKFKTPISRITHKFLWIPQSVRAQFFAPSWLAQFQTTSHKKSGTHLHTAFFALCVGRDYFIVKVRVPPAISSAWVM